MDNTPSPVLQLSGTPKERGKIYGRKCKPLIEKCLTFYRTLFEKESNLNWQNALDYAAKFKPFIIDYDPEIMMEIEGIAAGADKSVDDIVALNTRTELMFLQKTTRPASCTSFAAMPETNVEGKMYLAQNWDWYRQAVDFCVTLVIDQGKRPMILQTVEAGLIAKMGFNSAGIGVCTNALVTDQWKIGVPYHVILRGILNATTMAEAIGAVTKPVRASAGNYMIGHQEGFAIDLEATPMNVNIIKENKGILTHANHFQASLTSEKDLIPSLWPDSIVRELRLEGLLKASSKTLNLDLIKKILRDHFDLPGSICTHPEALLPIESQSQTNASVILDLKNQVMHLAKGLPCEHEYHQMTLSR